MLVEKIKKEEMGGKMKKEGNVKKERNMKKEGKMKKGARIMMREICRQNMIE